MSDSQSSLPLWGPTSSIALVFAVLPWRCERWKSVRRGYCLSACVGKHPEFLMINPILARPGLSIKLQISIFLAL